MMNLTRISTIIWLGLVILLIFSGCSGDSERKVDCNSLRVGTFNLRSRIEGRPVSFKIERTNTLQTEIHEQTGKSTTLSVAWTGPCTYETLLLETTMPFADSIQEVRKKEPLSVSIIEVSEEYYVFEAQRRNFKSIRDTLWRIEQ